MNLLPMKQKTSGVIEDVKLGESEIGILYLDDFNERILMKSSMNITWNFMRCFEAGPTFI